MKTLGSNIRSLFAHSGDSVTCSEPKRKRMKLLWLLLFLLTCAVTSSAQEASTNVAPTDVEILKIKWSKETSSLMLGRPFMDASTPSASGPVFDPNQDSHTPLRVQQNSPVGPHLGRPRVRYVYSMKIKNNGSKTIKAVAWEHIFLDPGNRQELSRVPLRSFHKVSPSKSVTLEGETNRPPARVVSVEGLQKDSRSPFDEHVEVKCVMYSDGTFWKGASVDERVCRGLKKAKRINDRSIVQ